MRGRLLVRSGAVHLTSMLCSSRSLETHLETDSALVWGAWAVEEWHLFKARAAACRGFQTRHEKWSATASFGLFLSSLKGWDQC